MIVYIVGLIFTTFIGFLFIAILCSYFAFSSLLPFVDWVFYMISFSPQKFGNSYFFKHLLVITLEFAMYIYN
jgi:hypothetical protein